MTRVSIFSGDGSAVGDIGAAPNYEWILNADPGAGRCEFTVSLKDEKCTEDYLRFGNYVLIRDEYLPDWIGVIVERTWSADGIDILALQAEYILDKRNTPNLKVEGSAGSIFTQILQFTNSQILNEKVIVPTDIYTGGTSREETLGSSALTHIINIASRSGNDFNVYHFFDGNNSLRLAGNWYQQRGVEDQTYLREGYNIELTNGILSEDGREIVNWLEGRGDASTTGTRISTLYYDADSISKNGLNQGMTVFDGNRIAATLEDNTINKLKEKLNPTKTFDITVTNIDNIFERMDIGNIYNLKINSAGFDSDGRIGTQAQVRVYGMSYNSMSNKLRLAVEAI